jgi:hypothetical protein
MVLNITLNKDMNAVKKYSFESSEYKSVTIGRDNKCTLCFPDKGFSKIQTTLLYDSEKKYWKIRDGSIEKSSTNGTWVYAIHSYEIVDNTILEIFNSKLRVSICS